MSVDDICTYTLDTPACVPLAGAKLSGVEVYGDDETLAGYFEPKDESHTATSMSIAVLKWQNPGTDTAKLVKVREATYPLPHT